MSSCGPRLVRDHRRRAQPVVATTPARRVAFIFRTWRLFHVRGLAGASSATSFRGAVATAVGWAVLLVSTSVEVCVARERALGPESRRSRRLACRALCPAARRCQRCVRARFGRILAAKCFLLLALREGARFAGGLARCGCWLSCLVLAVFQTRKQIFDPSCTGQIGKFRGQIRNHGFFLLRIQMTLIFSNPLSQRSQARERWGAWSSGMIHP